MKKPLALLLIIAVSLPFIGCTGTQPPGRDTVFHRAEESPRTGMTQRSRYGAGGTHSPSERTASRNQPSQPSDPDGIVKPRDLDPETADPEVVSTDPDSDQPENTATESPSEPTPPSSEIPYAEAVPGKYGLVYSPFVKDKKNGLVNVTDENDVPLPPGTEVTDPHTGKVFRVP